jgi:hypothetical protein
MKDDEDPDDFDRRAGGYGMAIILAVVAGLAIFGLYWIVRAVL